MIGLKVVGIGQHKRAGFSALTDIISCLLGVFIYFFIMNILLYSGVDPVYLKFLLGVALIFFLSTAKSRYQEVLNEARFT
jgi:ABC-type uncharacterized transport system permease subunit